jgi:hypothetical protein
MITNIRPRSIVRGLAAGIGLAVGLYGAYAAAAWLRYGRPSLPTPDQQDDLLERFMPVYDVAERHNIHVSAPAAVVLEAGKEQDLLDSVIVRAIFKARETVLRATPTEREPPRGVIAATQALGWGVLADVPGREIVMGAVTRPWEANVTFRALAPQEFASFSEPGFVKIAWTLRADPVGDHDSIFRTETRAVATDAAARAAFRRYWAFASPGIELIRRLSLRPLRQDVEQQVAQHATAAPH